MSVKGFKNHPYIPNSVPEVEQEMLHELGLNSLEELHAEVPDEIILKREMDLPEAFGSEYELRRHVEGVLKKNKTCADNLNFLGAGCWQHYVPALCDEINGKGEFVTAYGGESYNDFGRFQSLFEDESLMAELVDMLEQRGEETLYTIRGTVPGPGETFPGCRFCPRCDLGGADCAQTPPPLTDLGGGHLVRCHHPC